MKYFLLGCVIFFIVGCKKRNETEFSQAALNETIISTNGDELKFKNVLQKYKGQKVLIDIWASWCGDCIRGMPKIVELQKRFPNVIYLFVSIDESLKDLMAGIKKYKVQGEHYLLPSKWEGDFSEFLGLSWIPRYLVIDEQGKIVVFDEVDANAEAILNALNNN
ncbi:TlpA family protein disulfide reductase [Tenacibaculum sp. MEBiC06402]|uniref:TlpA family protein disulfide reductase n=1 Tax=unclassified Tenacibaculum TaxID=2635139 RepID=UPI003B9AFB9E